MLDLRFVMALGTIQRFNKPCFPKKLVSIKKLWDMGWVKQLEKMGKKQKSVLKATWF